MWSRLSRITVWDDLLIFVRGDIEWVADDQIVVDGVVIAPASAFIPAELSVGQEVVVVGYLLNDHTLMAVELIIVDENFDECGEYGTARVVNLNPKSRLSLNSKGASPIVTP